MRRIRTRILATLGPASSSQAVLRRMMEAGLDAVRLNFSHGTPESHLERVRLVRSLNRRRRRSIEILQDLEGPRIRIGALPEGPVAIRRRQIVWLVRRDADGLDEAHIPLDYDGPFGPIRKAEFIFIQDGTIVLAVRSVRADRIRTEVVVGGTVGEHKGVNIPEADLEFPLLSAKDEADIRWGVVQGVEYVAQSFVRNREDIAAVAEIARSGSARPRIVAKIEDRRGIENLDAILDVADGIIVARGDLGVSLPIWEVPVVQKRLIARTRRRRKFVVTATQMLESMIDSPRPTRAEVADVANAVLDGSDFVMLSGETAVGRYPAETVRVMNRIVAFTEASRDPR